ncbi:hypothetical protein P171DRAFT_446427 [Karstenula rhodostoma CBS 690.94]|uniref:Uncharacterized protein n=1 Tax=Karstenula rhodostoma CBS 690.94 TaxID=1392251 RepID=A0A9P4PEN2_9PLEO|nr:hypothetical protein P171DRAFT_446427 [Karstenula rhodostoma CBS 690.94]
MCKLYLQTIYNCGCHGHANLPGRSCASYRQSATAAHGERGNGDVVSRPCVSVVPVMRLSYACPRHRGYQEYWSALPGWEGDVWSVAGPTAQPCVEHHRNTQFAGRQLVKKFSLTAVARPAVVVVAVLGYLLVHGWVKAW